MSPASYAAAAVVTQICSMLSETMYDDVSRICTADKNADCSDAVHAMLTAASPEGDAMRNSCRAVACYIGR